MTYFLWQLLRDAYQELGQLQVAQATGGTTTTLVDSQLSGGRDDDWNGGTVIVLDDAGGAGDAPEGEFAVVTDYEDTSGTLMIDTLTAAVAAGDTYGLANALYPLRQMIELANLALKGLGDILQVDTVTLTTAAGQTEYSAAAAWQRRPPIRVDIQTNTNDADDNRWEIVRGWEFVPAAAGSAGLIGFRTQPTAGRKLRVWYLGAHPRLEAYDDPIHESIVETLAAAAVVEKALLWQVSRLDGQNDFLLQRLNDARSALEQARQQHPIWRGTKHSRGIAIRGRGKNGH